MKIIEIYDYLWQKYQNKLRIIKKGIFWILLNEEAFFIAKTLNFKITALDKQNIKVWFPDNNKDKWLKVLENKWLWFVLYDKKNDFEFIKKWNYYTKIFLLHQEDYNLTRERVLQLKEFNLEEKNIKNFLLKDKYEKLYFDIIDWSLRLPKKDRYFIREHIEKKFLFALDWVYSYMYNLWERKELIQNIFSQTLLIREFLRFFYKRWYILKDMVFVDFSSQILEILKISKALINKS